ncbi:MAG TPA: ATP-binding protein [Steroidobacteraceae bacterium]|nr:ATP-binding protein [Steroidobacteraceae bacterium]
MREQFRQLVSVLQLDYRKVKLSWLLSAINVLIVLLVVVGISFSAVRLLRNLADNQGLVRVQFAGATAREELRKINEDFLTSARDLARRPALRRLLDEDSQVNIELYLRRSCQQLNADVCAIARNDNVIAQSDPGLIWKDLQTASSEQGERFMFATSSALKAVLGAVAVVPESSGTVGDTRVFVLKTFDDKLAARLSERAGLEVRFVDHRASTASPNALTRLHSVARSDGRGAAARIDELDIFAASVLVEGATGEPVTMIEVRLPTAELDASVSALVRRLLITALVLGALAVFAGVVLGKQVADPVRALTDAAERLGQGDFSTSIPADGAAEVGVLSRTMEDMRRNLVDLTTALRQREAEAQAVLNGVVEGVYAVDKSRMITYLNPQATRLLGINAQDAIGKFCGDVLKPCRTNGQRPCERACPIVQARENGSGRAVEYLEVASGAPRTAIITSSAPVAGLQVQVIRDETDLEAVRRARDSVLANISHEFRTPLAAQLASIELLRDGLDSMSDAQRRELVMSLERGTHRLTRLIDNLLESVRIESGQLAIRKQTLDLADVVEDARILVSSLFDSRKQRLEVSIPKELPSIEGDGPRLVQVFVNLLANANKYAPEQSAVRVGAEVQESGVIVWVEDEGPGVSEAAQGLIFDRFSRGSTLESGEEPEPGGLGLGLWIVKSIVERHGGSVRTERTAEGRTRFCVSLPASIAQ